MKFDRLDNKIQEAAREQGPAFTEDAWIAMERLLDEHLPQQPKRRRRGLWLLLTFFVVCGSILTVALINGTSTPVGNKLQNERSIQEGQPVKRQESNGASVEINKPEVTPNDDLSLGTQPAARSTASGKQEEIAKASKRQPVSASAANLQTQSTPQESSFSLINRNPSYIKQSKEQSIIDVNTSGIPDETVLNIRIPIGENVNKQFQFKVPVAKERSIVQAKAEEKVNPETPKHGVLKNISFSLSAGPDVSAVSYEEIGRTKLLVGAGISYNLSKRWAVRSGLFYVTKKYGASPTDYNPPPQFWSYYPNLKSIEADCKVYEVPLILQFNFSQKSQRNLFVSAGLSSYFMKKEAYEYYSKDASGQTQYQNYTLSNKSSHYLASLRLSAGYSRKLTDRISLAAEPYFNLPIKGVGYGKVNLYSAGVFLSLNVSPWASK